MPRYLKPSPAVVSRILRIAGHPKAVLSSSGALTAPGFQVMKGWTGEVLVLDRCNFNGVQHSRPAKLDHYAQTLASHGYSTRPLGTQQDYRRGMDKIFRIEVLGKR